MKSLPTRSSACCAPAVTTTSSGSASMSSSAISITRRSRNPMEPCPPPYCSATSPCSANTVRATSSTWSSGRAWTNGIPPASDTTSGRSATANSARTSDAVMPAARVAYRSTKRSIESSAIGTGDRVGKRKSVAALHGAAGRWRRRRRYRRPLPRSGCAPRWPPDHEVHDRADDPAEQDHDDPDDLRPGLEARVAGHPDHVHERPDHQRDRADEQGDGEQADEAGDEPVHQDTAGTTSVATRSSMSRSSYSSWFKKMRCTPMSAYARSRSIARSGV